MIPDKNIITVINSMLGTIIKEYPIAIAIAQKIDARTRLTNSI